MVTMIIIICIVVHTEALEIIGEAADRTNNRIKELVSLFKCYVL